MYLHHELTLSLDARLHNVLFGSERDVVEGLEKLHNEVGISEVVTNDTDVLDTISVAPRFSCFPSPSRYSSMKMRIDSCTPYRKPQVG